jgi:hypothetical protein
MALSENCFKESTPDVQNWEILNQIETSATAIEEAIQAAQGFQLPPYDFIDLDYYGATNNISTVVFKDGGSGGTTVGTLTLTYTPTQPPVDDDALLDTVTLS